MTAQTDQGALTGTVVLDFTQVYMGPSATQMLADYGAEVIKVERPDSGDLSRNSLPDPAGQDNPIFISINRNKRSVTIDTRSENGREVANAIRATKHLDDRTLAAVAAYRGLMTADDRSKPYRGKARKLVSKARRKVRKALK